MSGFNVRMAAFLAISFGILGLDFYRSQAQTASAGRAVFSEVCNDPLTITAGSNRVLLAQSPVPGTVRLYRNGLRMTPYTDYGQVGRAVTFTVPLIADDILLADYRY
jgi:hypothetical protein